MCRYAHHQYKPHYACFQCRKTFKRQLLSDITGNSKSAWQNYEAKCPQCGAFMVSMGMDFEAPPQNDLKKWKMMEGLYMLGETFHSCGCSGPGYRPRDHKQYIAYLEKLTEQYTRQLDSYKNTVPKTEDTFKAITHWEVRIMAVQAEMQKL